MPGQALGCLLAMRLGRAAASAVRCRGHQQVVSVFNCSQHQCRLPASVAGLAHDMCMGEAHILADEKCASVPAAAWTLTGGRPGRQTMMGGATCASRPPSPAASSPARVLQPASWRRPIWLHIQHWAVLCCCGVVDCSLMASNGSTPWDICFLAVNNAMCSIQHKVTHQRCDMM
jgi:hypothetical protein